MMLFSARAKAKLKSIRNIPSSEPTQTNWYSHVLVGVRETDAYSLTKGLSLKVISI